MSAPNQEVLDPPEGGAALPETGDNGASEVEARARRMGWLPREEFGGPPERWRPAAEFVERAETILPVLQEQFRAMDSRYAALQRQAEEARASAERERAEAARTLAEMTEMMRRGEARTTERLLREIEARRAAALEAGDTAAFHAADQERDALRQVQPPQTNGHAAVAPAAAAVPPAAPARPVPPTIPPEIVAFAEQNPWFRTDPEATNLAVALYGQMETANPGDSVGERLAKVRQTIARVYPEHFANPRRDAPSPVGAPSAAPARPRDPRSFDALPGEVKTQYERWRKQLEGRGKPLTKEEFAKNYWDAEG